MHIYIPNPVQLQPKPINYMELGLKAFKTIVCLPRKKPGNYCLHYHPSVHTTRERRACFESRWHIMNESADGGLGLLPSGYEVSMAYKNFEIILIAHQ